MASEPTNQDNGASVEQAGLPAKAPGGPLSGVVGIVACLALFSVAGYLAYRTLNTGQQEKPDPPPIVYMCSDTGKTFQHKPQMGESVPVQSPHSDKRTGYPVEKCFWTRDGKQKTKPTYVILNDHLGKEGTTICPDCGRPVLPHNPLPDIETELAPPERSTTRPAQPTADGG